MLLLNLVMLSVATLNLRGFREEHAPTIIRAMMENGIMCTQVQETWLRGRLEPIGYDRSPYRWKGKNKPDQSTGGPGSGGLGFLIHEDLYPYMKERKDLCGGFDNIMWMETKTPTAHIFKCNVYMSWDGNNTEALRGLMWAQLQETYLEVTMKHPGAYIEIGGDFNCRGLRWDATVEEWKAVGPDSRAFLQLVRDTGLHIVNKNVPGTGTFTRFQGGERSTLDLILVDPKLWMLTKSYHADSECKYNVSSDHRLVFAHTSLPLFQPPGAPPPSPA
jgi:hypothetical protein